MKLLLGVLDEFLILRIYLFESSMGLCFTSPNRFYPKAEIVFRLVFSAMRICNMLHTVGA